MEEQILSSHDRFSLPVPERTKSLIVVYSFIYKKIFTGYLKNDRSSVKQESTITRAEF